MTTFLQTMNNSKPFLKWAGGKRQLLPDLISRLPKSITDSKKIENYIEPFIGGGSFFFYLKNNYEIKNAYISDINKDLVLSYRTIQNKLNDLLVELKKLQSKYDLQADLENKQFLFYEIRKEFNKNLAYNLSEVTNTFSVERSAQVIFLNRTCFNGLYRQNKKGEFNVPFGKYLNPTICDEDNLREVNLALQNVVIEHGDFELSETYAVKDSLIYLDPPYRPIKVTSSFTSYAKEDFGDEDQKRLAEYYSRLSKKGCSLILSNSDPKNNNKSDNFFDDLYSKFNITRVSAKRAINSKVEGRGSIFELMITNYRLNE